MEQPLWPRPDRGDSPIIVVTAGLSGRVPGAQLNASYIEAVQAAGGVPLLLPPQLEPGAQARLLGLADALLLTGGGDVDPERYHEKPHPAVTGVSALRDGVEFAAIEFALGRELPVLAICRGMQVLNVALGGSLVQDIPTQVAGARPHAVPEPRDGPCHPVRVAAASRLRAVVGADEIEVNSRHHQAVGKLGRGLEAVAWSPDGIVEGLEMQGRQVLAVQWHPEDMVAASGAARALFETLVRAARERATSG